jgi:hypothetical protein
MRWSTWCNACLTGFALNSPLTGSPFGPQIRTAPPLTRKNRICTSGGIPAAAFSSALISICTRRGVLPSSGIERWRRLGRTNQWLRAATPLREVVQGLTQGKERAIELLKRAIQALEDKIADLGEAASQGPAVVFAELSKDVFIVHGRARNSTSLANVGSKSCSLRACSTCSSNPSAAPRHRGHAQPHDPRRGGGVSPTQLRGGEEGRTGSPGQPAGVYRGMRAEEPRRTNVGALLPPTWR